MRLYSVALILTLASCGGKEVSDGAAVSGAATPAPFASKAEPPPGGAVSDSPPPVAGPGALALQISVGGSHACALLEGGTVSCWGSNNYQEIGNTAAQERNALPLAVTGLHDVTAIAAGGYHTCAIASDRTVSCWGWNEHGQLGDGTTNDSETPVRVQGLSDVVEISAGSLHTCARLADRTVRCWGLDHQGQLGDGRAMVEAQPTPVSVSGLTDAVAISAGDLLTCAVLADGSARCWGDDCSGEVGDNNPLPTCFRATPTPVVNLGSVVAVAAGEENACAATADGRAYCWGGGPSGHDGTSTAQVVAGLDGVIAIAAGAASCALDHDGAVWCWGDNQAGELGDGTTAPRANPAVVPGLTTVKQLSDGGLNVCALQQDGHVFCWGRNDGGQVGDGTTAERHAPSRVSL